MESGATERYRDRGELTDVRALALFEAAESYRRFDVFELPLGQSYARSQCFLGLVLLSSETRPAISDMIRANAEAAKLFDSLPKWPPSEPDYENGLIVADAGSSVGEPYAPGTPKGAWQTIAEKLYGTLDPEARLVFERFRFVVEEDCRLSAERSAKPMRGEKSWFSLGLKFAEDMRG